MRPAALALLLALLLGAPACSPRQDRGLLVFAAASLSDVLPPLADLFGLRRALRVDCHFAGSSSLVNQVLRGAPADVLVLAGRRPLERLEGRVALVEDVAANRLVLVTAATASLPGPWPEAVAGPAVRHLALADPATAPAGAYGRQSLEALGLWSRLEGRIVPALDVRAALALVRTGQVEAAVVYASDANSTRDVQVVATLPEGTHDPILYPAAVPTTAPHPAEAQAFVEFLSTPEARRAFEAAGFAAPPSATTPAGQ